MSDQVFEQLDLKQQGLAIALMLFDPSNYQEILTYWQSEKDREGVFQACSRLETLSTAKRNKLLVNCLKKNWRDSQDVICFGIHPSWIAHHLKRFNFNLEQIIFNELPDSMAQSVAGFLNDANRAVHLERREKTPIHPEILACVLTQFAAHFALMQAEELGKTLTVKNLVMLDDHEWGILLEKVGLYETSSACAKLGIEAVGGLLSQKSLAFRKQFVLQLQATKPWREVSADSANGLWQEVWLRLDDAKDGALLAGTWTLANILKPYPSVLSRRIAQRMRYEVGHALLDFLAIIPQAAQDREHWETKVLELVIQLAKEGAVNPQIADCTVNPMT